MCHLLYLSTTAEEDLSELPSKLYSFAKPKKEDRDAVALLQYPNKWFLICQYGGCSCHFRHCNILGSGPTDFDAPQDWYPEDDDDIESTAAVYDFLLRLVSEGNNVDVLDSWNGDDLDKIKTIDVSLTKVPREAFRFIESYRFIVAP